MLTRSGQASSSRHGLRGRFVFAATACALAAGCIDDIGTSSGSSGGGGIGGDVLPLDAEPRVDLPGRVSVFFQVLGPGGTGVANLEGSEFELLEDGVPVSQSESKQRLLARPRVFRSYSLLLLDRSGSIADSPTGEQEEIDAARAYIELVGQSPESFIALAWFDGSASIRPLLLDDFTELGFSNDREKLLEAIDNLHDQPPTSTSTNLNGAVLRGLAELDEVDAEAIARGIDFRALTLVTFTDGSDQAGTTPIEDVRERLAETVDESGRKRYRAFTIGLGSEINPPALRELGPDGTAFAQGVGDLTPQFELIGQAVADVANSFYFLSYCSPKQDGSGDHSLTVRVRRSDLVAEEVYQFNADYFSGGCGFVDFFTPVDQPGETRVGDLAADADGNVLVVGSHRAVGASVTQLSLVRVTPDGAPDEDFGALGRVLVSQTETFPSLRGTSVAVDTDGTIVVGGLVGTGDLDAGATRAALWRFGPDGALLASQVVDPRSSDGDAIHALALDSVRRIVAEGCAGRTGSRTAVWRFGSSLQPDLGFADLTGYVLHEAVPGFPEDAAQAVAVAPDDSIVVVANARSSVFAQPDFELLRLTPTGQLDTSFAGGAVRGHAVQSQVASRASAVAVDSQGRVVVGGSYAEPGLPERPAVWRFRADGSPDAGFQGSPFARFFGTGMVALPADLLEQARIFFHDRAAVRDLAIAPDDSVVAFGMRMNAAQHTDVASWRFGADGVLERAYNGTGFMIEDGSLGNGTHEEAHAVLLHPDGRIFAAGTARLEGSAAEEAVLGLWIDSETERVFAPTGTN